MSSVAKRTPIVGPTGEIRDLHKDSQLLQRVVELNNAVREPLHR